MKTLKITIKLENIHYTFISLRSLILSNITTQNILISKFVGTTATAVVKLLCPQLLKSHNRSITIL